METPIFGGKLIPRLKVIGCILSQRSLSSFFLSFPSLLPVSAVTNETQRRILISLRRALSRTRACLLATSLPPHDVNESSTWAGRTQSIQQFLPHWRILLYAPEPGENRSLRKQLFQQHRHAALHGLPRRRGFGNRGDDVHSRRHTHLCPLCRLVCKACAVVAAFVHPFPPKNRCVVVTPVAHGRDYFVCVDLFRNAAW